MTRLRKISLPADVVLTEELILKSLNSTDLHEHFSITDLPQGMVGTSADLPAATVVFDLAGSTLSIRERGAKAYAANSQDLFRGLTDKIYQHGGIVEKFPGDGISMHFPAVNVSKKNAIVRAFKAILEMNYFLRVENGMKKEEYRFTLSYGDDTIVTKFGNKQHNELISIGHAVNVAHKLEKRVKNDGFSVGMDNECKKVIETEWSSLVYHFRVMPSELCRDTQNREAWYGVNLQ
ncbi:hypothetical protein ACFX4N_28750 [Priestia sp. YIM B13551]|uniref:hypothetical protein n=1 Tax=Priestia sp. YIM B13551 TaxID=3366306 RepID=UPI00366C6FE3